MNARRMNASWARPCRGRTASLVACLSAGLYYLLSGPDQAPPAGSCTCMQQRRTQCLTVESPGAIHTHRCTDTQTHTCAHTQTHTHVHAGPVPHMLQQQHQAHHRLRPQHDQPSGLVHSNLWHYSRHAAVGIHRRHYRCVLLGRLCQAR